MNKQNITLSYLLKAFKSTPADCKVQAEALSKMKDENFIEIYTDPERYEIVGANFEVELINARAKYLGLKLRNHDYDIKK